MTIKIFISFAKEDKGKMLSLCKRIQAHSPLMEPIVVEDGRRATTLLSDMIKGGIEDCNYFVCILTTKSITNQWVNQEIGYATALNKQIRPLVESQVMGKLKGFVHKEMQLPYFVQTRGKTPQSQRILFSKRAKVLIDDIILDNGLVPKEVGIESFFLGVWARDRDVKGKTKTNPKIEIKNGSEYYSLGRINYHVEDFEFNSKKNEISFVKRNPSDNSTAANVLLRVVKLNERYEGTENGRPVVYRRVS